MDKLLPEILLNHRGKFFGSLFGLIFSILVIKYGFLQTIFIGFCIYLGFIVGKRIDDNESLREVMERIFKER